MFAQSNIVVYALYVLAGMNAVFIVAIYGLKLRNIRQRKIAERFQRKFADYLKYIQAHLESKDPLKPPPTKMNRIETVTLRERLINLVETVTGKERQKLIELCDQLGFVDMYLRRLAGRSYSKKIDAAYQLGCMRVKEAVPELMQLLREHPVNSSFFVVARAIAKCARSEKDIGDLARLTVSKGKSFPDLVVDIIEEADVNHSFVFEDFIRDEQPAVVAIGLAGLTEYTNPAIAASVYRLLDHTDETIRKKATEIYLQSSILVPKNVIHNLIVHPSVEIRLMMIRALSEMGHPAYIDTLHQCLKDEDRRVVYASAMGLLREGQRGMTLFCETARDSRVHGNGTFLQEIIEEELRALSSRGHTLSELTRYNTLLYTYEKTFGKAKRLYRVV